MTTTGTHQRFQRVDERGCFTEILAEGTWKTIIHGRMEPLAVMGNHYHKLTRIYFYLTSGGADVDIVTVATGQRRHATLATGEGIFLEPNEAHALTFRTQSEFIIAKSHRYDPKDTYTYAVSES